MSPDFGRAGKGLLEGKMSVGKDLLIKGFVSLSEDEPLRPFLDTL